MRVLHLSDTHLTAPGGRYHVLDPEQTLRRVLAALGSLGDIDLVVVSGDLSEDGSPQSYRLLRELVGEWAEAHGAPAVYAMGNHDARAPMRAELVPPASARPDAAPDGPVDHAHDVAGVRVVVLDSSVPGRGYGDLDDEQLAWLGDQLDGAPAGGALVVLHHPPLPASTPLLARLELVRPERLAGALRGHDVRAVLAGHLHHPVTGLLGGVPVVVAPAVASRIDLLAPAGHERAVVGSGAALVTTGAPGHVRVEQLAVPTPQDGSVVFDIPPSEVARLGAALGWGGG